MPRSGPPRIALLAVFVAGVLACTWFPALSGANENSRLGLVMAVVERGTLTIDAYWQQPGSETSDASSFSGHVYSDKAIGTAVLGIPAYLVARPWLRRFDADPVRRSRIARMLVTWVAVSLPAALAVAVLFALAWRASGSGATAATVAAAGLLATPLWPFATTLFGHATVAALLVVALFLARQLRIGGTRHPLMTSALTGLVLGIAMITEYPAAVVAALLVASLCHAIHVGPGIRSRGRCVAAAASAAALPLVLLLSYNTACFGSPFTLSYARIANPEFASVHASGLLGVGLPDPLRLVYLTVHPVRGLFAQSPILLAAIAGLVPMASRPAWRIEAAIIALALPILLLINAGFSVWWGGWSFAPRHLVPWAVMGCLPLAFLDTRWRPLMAVLLLVSVCQMAIPTVTTPTPSDDDVRYAEARGVSIPWRTSPIWGSGWKHLGTGRLRDSLATLGGLPEVPSTALVGALIVLLLAAAGSHARVIRRPST